MAKLDEILMDAERIGMRIQLIDKVAELTKSLPGYTPLEQIYELAFETVKIEKLTQDL